MTQTYRLPTPISLLWWWLVPDASEKDDNKLVLNNYTTNCPQRTFLTAFSWRLVHCISQGFVVFFCLHIFPLQCSCTYSHQTFKCLVFFNYLLKPYFQRCLWLWVRINSFTLFNFFLIGSSSIFSFDKSSVLLCYVMLYVMSLLYVTLTCFSHKTKQPIHFYVCLVYTLVPVCINSDHLL